MRNFLRATRSGSACCLLAALFFLLPMLSTPCRATLAPPAQSASAAATAGAGAEATGRDASTAFYNPAALTLLGRNELTVNAAFVLPRTRFGGAAKDPLGLPVTGSTTVSDSTQILPSAFGLWVPSSALRVALAVTEPFGQSVTYDNSWVGRYFATRGKLEVIDISPVVGWRVNDWLSLGGGADYPTRGSSGRRPSTLAPFAKARSALVLAPLLGSRHRLRMEVRISRLPRALGATTWVRCSKSPPASAWDSPIDRLRPRTCVRRIVGIGA